MPDAPTNFDSPSPMTDPNNSIGLINRAGNASEDPEAPAITTRSEAPAPITGGLAGQAAQPTAPVAPVTPVAPAQAQPAKPGLPNRIADSIVSAFKKSDGSAGGFLRSALAGGLAGLAASAQHPAPHGHILGDVGIGAEAAMKQADAEKQQQFENKQKQDAANLAKQKQQQEVTTGDRDYDLRLREDARQQATSIREAADFEKRSTLMDQQIAQGNFTSMKDQAEYLQQQSDAWNDLKSHGGKPLEVNGVPAPEFEHLGDAEDFANKNPDATMHDQYKTRLMRNPDSGKWVIMETPYEAPKWHDITDAAGKPQRIFTDTMGALAAQEQVAKTKHYMNIAGKSSLELKQDLEDFKEDGTVKGARKELNDVNGDYTKLSPGSKSALTGDANKRFMMAQSGLEKELAKPEELRDKDTVDTLTQIRNTYGKELADLTRPAWVDKNANPNAPAAPNANQPAPAKPAPPRPANVPANYVYVEKGPGGVPGWQKPQPTAAQ